MSKPMVSVVVPAFNAEATLEETLLSAAAQTYPNVEIIIVDDGSTDQTVKIASRFCSNEARARLLRTPHRGVSAARNAGIAVAEGKYVAFLDADDLWDPAKLDLQVQTALSFDEIGFVYTFYRRIDASGDKVEQPVQFQINGPAFWRHLYWNFVGAGSSILAPKQALREIGGFDENVHGSEDHLVQLQLAARYPIACVPEVLFSYRHRPFSVSANENRMLREWRGVVRILRSKGLARRGRVVSWTYSRACWGLAVTCLRRGNLLRAAHFFLSALYRDPTRTFCNARRALARMAGIGIGTVSGQQVIYDLDRRRMRRLAEWDAEGRFQPFRD